MSSFSIDDEFRRHLIPLTPHEFTFLEQSIAEEGCRHPLIVWQEESLLIDGHHRHDICTKLGRKFDVMQMSFGSRDDALDWVDKNQASRRNCTPTDLEIIRGRIYNRRKKAHGGERGASTQVGNLKTAEVVAEELGASKNTVIRNGQRAEVYDAMLDIGDTEAAEAAKYATQAEVKAVRGKAPEEAAAELKKNVHVSNNSGNNEWYTPLEYLAAARLVMGSITTDPASCETAQQNVKAKTFFTEDDDGLAQDWRGNVWLNPPYGSTLIVKFCEKLIEEVSAGNAKQAIVLVNNATETRWFHLLANHSAACCFTLGRIQFLDATNNPKQSPLQGQCFLYFGPNDQKFTSVFSQFGVTWSRA